MHGHPGIVVDGHPGIVVDGHARVVDAVVVILGVLG